MQDGINDARWGPGSGGGAIARRRILDYVCTMSPFAYSLLHPIYWCAFCLYPADPGAFLHLFVAAFKYFLYIDIDVLFVETNT